MATFDKFDGQGRPVDGVDKVQGHFVISYDGSGDATWKFDNGSVAVYDAGGKLVSESAGGTTFDKFDGQGRPVDGVDKTGQAFTITYDGSGNATWKFANGDVAVYDPAGKLVSESSGGTTFNQFDGQGRPTAGVDKTGQAFTITYDGSGDATWKFANGDVAVYDPAGKLVSESSGGTTFNQFDGQGRPTGGVDKTGQAFTITYDGSGDATWKFANGDVAVYDPAGKLVSESSGGTTFNQFDGQGRPTGGVDKTGQAFTITYDGSGDATWKFGNGDVAVYDPAGKLVSESSGGTTFNQFDGQGRPTGGVDKTGQAFTITYDGSGDATWKFANGDVAVYDPAGKLVSESSGGTTFNQFDGQGRPTGGVDKTGQAFTITYDGSGDATWKFANGDVAVYDPGGKLVSESSGGTTFTKFDGQGRPTGGVDKTGQAFTITYDGSGDATWKFANGDVAVYDPAGKLVSESSGGTTFNQFDGQGRPTGGVDKTGQAFTITYDGSGDATWKFANGDVAVYDPAGKLVSESSGGTTFTKFDGQGRPTGGVDKTGQAFTITYDGSGDATWKFANGDVAVYDPAGKLVSESSGGTTFTKFDGQGRPTGGVDKTGQAFTITYDGSGNATWKFGNGDVAVYDPGGKLVSESSGGTTFTKFDGQNRPTAGVDKTGQAFTITYDGSGNATWKFGNGDVAVYDPGGKLVSESSGGTTFTKFDGQNRPTAGVDKTGQAFTITYDGSGNATWKFGNGDVAVYDPGGKLVSESSGGTTFTKFDGQNRPTAGVDKTGQAFTITYDGSGNATWKFGNGDVAVYDPGGKLVSESSGGTTFTKFDGQGRPTAGVDKNGQPFTITYDANGDVFTHYGDGSTTETDSSGHLIKTWLPDGTVIDWAVDLPALHAAIGQVSTERNAIADNFGGLRVAFGHIEDYWQSPAGKSFPPLVDTFSYATQAALAVFDDAIYRMRQAYDNYMATEGTNVKNLGGQ